jgi:hypothetical protein
MTLKSNHWLKLRLLSITPFTVIEIADQTGLPPRIFTDKYRPIWKAIPPLLGGILKTVQTHFDRSGLTPVFLESIPELDFLSGDFERMLGLNLRRYPVVWHSRAPSIPRHSLNLPLKLAAVDDHAPQWVEELSKLSWAKNDAAQTHGLAIQTGVDAAALIQAFLPHIVVTKQPDDVLNLVARLPEAVRPRLLVWFDETLDSVAPAARRTDVSGLALLRISAVRPAEISRCLQTLGWEFTHDKPLQEIAMAIAGKNKLRVSLVADPYSLQGLRLSEVLRALRREAQAIESQFSGAHKHPEISLWLSNNAVISDFLREGNAFLPMAGLMRSRDPVVSAVRTTMALARETTRAAVPRFTKTTPRSVQVAMERLDSQPFLRPVEPQTILGAGLAYQIRVQIGWPFPGSLVEQGVPIDPDLGPPDDSSGYNLEVAVQGKDFEVLSARSLPLFLPRQGGSLPVYFEIRTPQRKGYAELRLCVYHQNHLAQSYLLKASVGATETFVQEQATSVQVEFTRTGTWDEVDVLKPRAISLGMNMSPGGTHNIIIKGTGSAEEVSLRASTFDNAVKEVRKVLAAAAEDPANPGLAREYLILTKGAQPDTDVAETIRKLADWGNRLYGAFFARVVVGQSQIRPDLVRLAASGGEAIQVVRFAYEDTFPWALIYDWDRHVDENAPVCLGWIVGPDGRAVPCAHRVDSGVYCARGFWGVRHRVEELLQQPEGSVKSVSASAKGPAVRVVADSSLAGGQTLFDELTAGLGKRNVAFGPNQAQPLLNILFDEPDRRPSLLILLGHHEQRDQTAGGLASRLQIDGKPEWLSEEEVRQRTQKQPSCWNQPRSVILLMACESATTGLTTLTDFITTWNTSGAGAIVGTECVVGSKLAADFAQRFTHRVWKNKEELGSAMMGIRGELLAEGNPLAFLFSAVGDLDLNMS